MRAFLRTFSRLLHHEHRKAEKAINYAPNGTNPPNYNGLHITLMIKNYKNLLLTIIYKPHI